MAVNISPIKVIRQIFLINISVGKRRSISLADLMAFENLKRTEGNITCERATNESSKCDASFGSRSCLVWREDRICCDDYIQFIHLELVVFSSHLLAGKKQKGTDTERLEKHCCV